MLDQKPVKHSQEVIMRRYISVFLLLVGLMSCNTPADTRLDQELKSAAIYQEAYNEHVELNVGGIATGIMVNGNAVSFSRSGNRVFFDLPNPPFPFTALPPSDTAYKNRGTVNVSVTVTNGSTPFTKTYQPYGAVESGQINLLLPLQGLESGCPTSGFYRGFKIVHSSFSTSGSLTNRLCFLTLDIRETQNNLVTRRGTKQAITYLLQQISNEIVIDRNVLFSMDSHKSTYSSDPSCEQLEVWVNNENSNKLRIDTAKIKSEVNATTAHTKGIRGTGVRVAVIGGGVDTSVLTRPGRVVLSTNQNLVEPGQLPFDDFECDFDSNGKVDFALHETHAIEIISTIAPNASIIPIKICDHDGNCPSGNVVRALMYLENTYGGRIIVNLSAGGPLRDDTIFRFLETDPNRPNESFFFVASTGNNGRAVTHYPATLSPLSNPPGSNPTENLQNVISVAAYGVTTTGAYIVPLFNTRQNSDILGLGVNMCLPTVTLQCQIASDPGIGGTSFAAPMVTGVAALYTEAQPGMNLYNLLTTNAQLLPGTTLGKIWYQ
jgi:Subtilase family